jgi:hypothetical protein
LKKLIEKILNLINEEFKDWQESWEFFKRERQSWRDQKLKRTEKEDKDDAEI